MEKIYKLFGNNSKNKSVGLLILRVTVAIIFLLNGISKLVQHKELIGIFSGQLQLSAFWFWVVAISEVLAGLMMLVGYMTSLASGLIFVIMIVAMIMVTMKGVFMNPSVGFFPSLVTGLFNSQLPIVMLGSALAIFFTGSGKYSMNCGCKTCDTTSCSDQVCASSGHSDCKDKSCSC